MKVVTGLMGQSAQYPFELDELVEQLCYKQGWEFSLQHEERGQGCCGLTLAITITVPDSYDLRHNITVRHYMIVPAAAYNRQSWQRWLLEQILLVERHEACEFFIVNGVRPYAPHHGPGHDPYTVFEQGTKEDAQTTFRGERFELPAENQVENQGKPL